MNPVKAKESKAMNRGIDSESNNSNQKATTKATTANNSNTSNYQPNEGIKQHGGIERHAPWSTAMAERLIAMVCMVNCNGRGNGSWPWSVKKMHSFLCQI
jgi:hypothetical protein